MRRAASWCLALLLSAGTADAQDRIQALRASTEPAAERWMYSETVSPLDYAPVVIASAWSSDMPDDGPDGPALQLSIQCRRGRTDLVLASPDLAGRPEELRVIWTVDDGPPATLPAGAAPTGAGLSIKGDAVRLLASLPDAGELVLRVTTIKMATPQAPPLYGRYAIAPLRTVLGRMAAPCKWPMRRP